LLIYPTISENMPDATSNDSSTVLETTAHAKINLFLAITGRREDGFHELLSLVWPLDFGDRLQLTIRPSLAGSRDDQCTLITDPQTDPIHFGKIPSGPENLALRAVDAFRRTFGLDASVHLRIEKKIPVGAGLGGGSSDAAAVLRLLARFSQLPFSALSDLHAVAASLGSDVPLFLQPGPVRMSGRGEILEPLEANIAHPWAQLPVLLIKPHFASDTAQAYRNVRPDRDFMSVAQAHKALDGMLSAKPLSNRPDTFCFNSFEASLFRKYPIYPVLHEKLQERFGLRLCLTGSGSSCFLFPSLSDDLAQLEKCFHEFLGDNAFMKNTFLAAPA
jgi:4-diphosphocytidyl-2-C-methyl-D-erythritol kinase